MKKIQITNEPTLDIPRELVVSEISIGLTQQINLVQSGETIFEGKSENIAFGPIFGDSFLLDQDKKEEFKTKALDLYLNIFFPNTQE